MTLTIQIIVILLVLWQDEHKLRSYSFKGEEWHEQLGGEKISQFNNLPQQQDQIVQNKPSLIDSNTAIYKLFSIHSSSIQIKVIQTKF